MSESENSPPELPPLSRRELRRRLRPHLEIRIWVIVVTLGVFFFWILSQTANVFQIAGPPWPTDPEVHPQNVVTGASLTLPFTIKNRSAFFDMNDVALTCGIDLVALEDADGHKLGADSIAFFTGLFSIPANAAPINYPCDASGLVQVTPNGGITFRGALSSPAGPFRAPLKILKMCIWIGGDYKIGPTNWSFTTNIFKWPAAQGVTQWIEGPTAVDQTGRQPIPNSDIDKLECRPSVSGPYVYIKGPGRPLFLPDALRRPR
jgi:hypothetical protein